MRTLLLHMNGIEMWEISARLHGVDGDSPIDTRYEIIEMMDRDLPEARRFGSAAAARAELHTLAARDNVLRLERMAMRKRRQTPRGWHALRAFWLLSDSVIRASHGRSRVTAIRALRARRLADRSGAVPAAPPWQAGAGRLGQSLRPLRGLSRQ